MARVNDPVCGMEFDGCQASSRRESGPESPTPRKSHQLPCNLDRQGQSLSRPCRC
jgi:hypothetical protein